MPRDNVEIVRSAYATFAEPGIEAAQRAFLVFTLRDGKVTRMETFADREHAVEAAGQE